MPHSFCYDVFDWTSLRNFASHGLWITETDYVWLQFGRIVLCWYLRQYIRVLLVANMQIKTAGPNVMIKDLPSV